METHMVHIATNVRNYMVIFFFSGMENFCQKPRHQSRAPTVY